MLLLSQTVFAPSHYPPPPPPCKLEAAIQGPSEGVVGEVLEFRAQVETENCTPQEYVWSLKEAPKGAAPWSALGREVSFCVSQ